MKKKTQIDEFNIKPDEGILNKEEDEDKRKRN